jgi:hypothetical protein
VTPDLVAHLTRYRIELLSESKEFWILRRESCIAFVHHREDGALGIGSSGMMTENGLAWLVWSEGEPRLVAKGSEAPASNEQVEMIRSFSEDLKKAMAASEPISHSS